MTTYFGPSVNASVNHWTIFWPLIVINFLVQKQTFSIVYFYRVVIVVFLCGGSYVYC